jgi:hypothetical protein
MQEGSKRIYNKTSQKEKCASSETIVFITKEDEDKENARNRKKSAKSAAAASPGSETALCKKRQAINYNNKNRNENLK